MAGKLTHVTLTRELTTIACSRPDCALSGEGLARSSLLSQCLPTMGPGTQQGLSDSF